MKDRCKGNKGFVRLSLFQNKVEVTIFLLKGQIHCTKLNK